jgi:hypothetical protein
MLKSSLAITAIVLALVLPAARAVTRGPAVRTIPRALLAQMNSGPDGRITRSVSCVPELRRTLTFACELTSTGSTRLRVDIAGTNGLRESWYPLQG